MAIFLASASPRRQELLRQIGCDFTVMVSDIIEDNQQQIAPEELAMLQAKDKAIDVASKVQPTDVIIGADTIVVLDGQVYGKPVDIEDAREMLMNLSGKEHQVITGIAVVKLGVVWTDFTVTNVRMAHSSKQQIEKYLATEEPMGKAGSYAIQGIGALLVEGITGCYNNVVGLPLHQLATVMEKAGVSLL